jgi:hypothetical protein
MGWHVAAPGREIAMPSPRNLLSTALVAALALAAGCRADAPAPDAAPAAPTDAAPPAPDAAPAAPAAPAPRDAARLVQPADLVYRGAFRLPEGSGGSDWAWSGDGLAYYPDGDPKGPADGHPGSLFGIGHDHQHFVSEISIPAPAVSASKTPADLPTAATLQPFADLRAGLFQDYEIYRSGLEYLPAQGKQASGKLHLSFGQHMQEGFAGASHLWADLDLAHPRVAGPWKIGDFPNYCTTDYIFAIPPDWAAAHAPGRLLATGRFRDGGQGSMGPTILAYGPWNEGNPPAAGARLQATTLLLYSAVTDDPAHTLRDYHHADEWEGAAWLTAGPKAAVVFLGTKGLGHCWYGFADGTVWPDEEPFPPIPPPPNDDRGWWSTRFEARMMFYDPDDLAAVAHGKMKPWEPQPYATLPIDDRLFVQGRPQRKHRVRAAAFDRARGHLYVFEPFADEDQKSLIHVWTVAPKP